ncbi:MAG: hypothetical protein M9894_12400 [Planctomycetes bacterium]|nr:hypothetical protein [Planctomycetota bacterium]
MSCDDVADLLDRPPAPGSDDDRRRAEHLTGCAACRALAGAHALARGALETDPPAPPAGLREELVVAAALLAKEKAPPAPAAPVRELGVRLRCTYCHAPLASPEAVYCADCLAPAHEDCFREHGRCPAPGCGGTQVVAPREGRPPLPRPLRPAFVVAAALTAAVGGVAALALTGSRDTGLALTSGSVDEWLDHDAPAGSDEPPPPLPPPPSPREPLRVLLVEGAPRWEYRYLKNALLRDPRVELQTLLLSADPGFEQERSRSLPPLERLPAPERLRDHDVIVVGDVAALATSAVPYLYPGAFDAIARAVVHGGVGLLVIDGERSGRGWGGTALGPLLPVRFDPAGPRVLDLGPFRPSRVDPARLRLLDDPAEDGRLWGDLPELHAFIPTERLTADAQVLLARSDPRAVGATYPLLATRRAGAGRGAWLGVDETWRWRAGVGDRVMARFYDVLLRSLRVDASPAVAGPGVELHDGRRVPGTVRRLRLAGPEGGTVVLEQGPDRLHVEDLAQVAAVHLSAGEPWPAGPALVLRDGSVLRGWPAGLGGGVLPFVGDALGEVLLPLDAVHALVMEPEVAREGALSPWRAPALTRDRVLRRGDPPVPVEGTITLLDRHQVIVRTDFGRVAVGLDQVSRIDWAPRDGADTPLAAPRALVALDDGTRLRCTLRALGDEVLRVHRPDLGERAVARRRVISVHLE